MEKSEFCLTQQHIMLLQAACVEWWDCETGAPAIDPKRPYGNSYVPGDVAEILGIRPEGDDDGNAVLTKEQESECLRLHRETETALQIVLQHGLTPGLYEQTSSWSIKWIPVVKERVPGFFTQESRRLDVIDVLKCSGRKGRPFRELAEATGLEDSLLIVTLLEMREIWNQIEQIENGNYRLR
jgi:hypothetical protein